jgi:hypothetical protein
MAQNIIDLLHNGAKANLADTFRRGNLILLPAQGELVVSGDLHGHRRNFERIVTFADLENHPERHLLLQEIIHGGPEDSQGGCLSYELLFDAVRYKVAFPDRVHIIMGNHDTTFVNDAEVMKNGKEMNRAMRDAIERKFNRSSDDVKIGIRNFLFSQPLALKCANRIWLSHSLPNERSISDFDPVIFERHLEFTDADRAGSVYMLTWGRKHSRDVLEKMAQMLDVDIFILGHQPQTQGWAQAGDNLIILASDHNHGCLLPVDLAKTYRINELIDSIVPLASIA